MSAPTFEQLQGDVLRWSAARGILDTSDSKTQLLKALSEMGELADAIIKRDQAGILDGLGDVVVCLINVAELEGTTLPACLAGAFEEIRNRQGKMNASGVFVKGAS